MAAPRSDANLAAARRSLDGLSVGDAFGQCFFAPQELVTPDRVAANVGPPPPWPYTDDTVMAVAVFEELQRHGQIEQEKLAMSFARRYADDPWRGYGGTAHRILRDIGAGVPWQHASAAVFDGMGSRGNGGAMRVAPVGAYFADNLTLAVEQAGRSAAVTHAHPEGQAGAIAVAVAAAFAWQHQTDGRTPALARDFFAFVVDHTPDGHTRAAVVQAADLPPSYSVDTAVSVLGNGAGLTAPDTVPLCLWIAARHWGDYPAALWTTASAGGDRDTTCAIVGGIAVLSASPDAGIPPAWLAAREPLPTQTASR